MKYLLFLMAVLLPATGAWAAPVNDKKANAKVLSGATASDTSNNIDATQEAGDFAERTVWWKWTAPASGTLTVSATYTVTDNAMMAVYLLESGTATGLVGTAQSYSDLPYARLTFAVAQGTTFLIGLGNHVTYNSGTCSLSLSLDTTGAVGALPMGGPSTMGNDVFAGRILLTGDSVSAVAYASSATVETGEPSTSGHNTFWWRYQPSATGRLTITTKDAGMNYPCVAVYQGTDLASLRLVGWSERSSSDTQLTLNFPVTAGTEYQIAYGNFLGAVSLHGDMVLSLALDKNADVSSLDVRLPASAQNNHFADRIALSGYKVSVIGYDPGTAIESVGPSTGINTLWWSWTAIGTGPVYLDFTGTDQELLDHGSIKVFQGDSRSKLTAVPFTWGSYPVLPRDIQWFNAVRGQVYHIALGSPYSLDVGSVVMTLVGTPGPPQFTLSPASLLISAGDPLHLDSAGVDTVSYQWLKNNVAVKNATAHAYDVAAAAMTDGGAYAVKATNKLGSTTSVVANVAVVNKAETNSLVNEGAAIKLAAPVSGPGLTYRWRLNGTDLADSKAGARVISGTGTAMLNITLAGAGDAGAYTCHVTMSDPLNVAPAQSADTGAIHVTLRFKPVVDAGSAPPPGMVSGAYAWQPVADSQPTGFVITGLPAGLVANGITGAVSGIPNVSGTFKVNVYAKNQAGAGGVRPFMMSVAALPAGTAGGFTGWVSRDSSLNGLLGGYLSFSVAGTGTFTGTLKNGTAAYPLSGRQVAAIGAHSTARVTIGRAAPLHALTLALDFDGANNAVSGTLVDPLDAADTTGAVVTGRRLVWSGTGALAFAGAYNSSVDLPLAAQGDVTQPLGAGWQQMTVTAAGTTTGTGRTAEGVAYGFAGGLWPDGSVPQFVLISLSKASVMGLPKITPGATAPENRVTGWVDEYKSGPTGAADRTYAAGIPYLQREVDGSPWVKPTTALPIVLGRADALGNASIAFTSGGVESAAQFASLAQTFRINKNNTATFAAAAAGNPCKVTMAVTASTGLFTGSFTLTDVVAGKPVIRTVSYAGLLLSHLNKGRGYFLLPGLSPGTATSAILGGRVNVN